jgi:hypothetical protein
MGFKMTENEREGYDILRAEMPEDLALELVEYRRRRKASITARIARGLLREYKAYGNIEKAIEQQMMRNWISFDCAWMPKTNSFVDVNNPIARAETPQERTERLDLFNQYRFARDEGNAQKAAEIRAKLNQATNRVQ